MTTPAEQKRSLVNFELDLDKFAEQMDIELRTVIRRLVIDVHDRIVERTPVDTGRARASWGIEQDVVGDYESEEGASLSSAAATTKAQGQQLKLADPTFDPFTIWWIFNNLPYIVALEYGHSSQAPAGMVRIAVAEVEAEILAVTQ